MPTITESADTLHQRMQQEKDPKKRQRLQALYVVASGHARYRQEIADLLGVHRHSGAAWLEAYAAGGLDQMLHYQVPRPPLRQRMPPTALTALHERLQDPHGVAGYAPLRTWLAEQHQVHLSYSGVYAVVRGKLRAKPKRPRPSHAKKIPQP
jgi:transposase